MLTTIIRNPLALAVASVAIAMVAAEASAQDANVKAACEGLAGYAQEFAMMRDTGMDMVTAMNHLIEREEVTEQRHIEWVYTLATIAYENVEGTPEDIGYYTFLSCMDLTKGAY